MKIMTSLIGVNNAYEEEIDTSPFWRFNYIVDIDNKKIFLKQDSEFMEEEDKEDFKNLENLQAYIESIIREKDKNIESIFLKTIIERLKKYLELVLSANPDYSPNPKNKYVNFFNSSPKMLESNKKIQE